ncbi:hypothetical protein PHJA_000063900 [Phtheirospermum japonicum]|uniref:Uncharacterized protein n=1 Tax=Phtheirospermum japonicum TaxID=374723 RepID=A0A830B408_9LAMI|nr:hypothetical protein PHJA_000063900 [Phtheirospermum japonicum]
MAARALLHHYHLSAVKSSGGPSGFRVSIKCSDSSSPNQNRGSSNHLPAYLTVKAPGLNSPNAAKLRYTSSDDLDFEQRLQAIRKSALEQKKAEVKKQYGVIDYEAPSETNDGAIGLGTKIGVGVAVLAFGLVFTLGDFLPSGSVSPTEQAVTGAAVTLAEMGEYKRAAPLLEKLTETKPSDPDAFRLLAEVKYELKDYEASILAYRNAEKASKSVDFEILRGLTNSLLAAKRPDEAVQELVACRERLKKENSLETRSDVDPIQVELLLGKAYSDWGHISDAISVYDQLISSHPDDFRGYLAKGIILKENGSVGDAERMFIQARFFAPDKAKVLVDKYSR